MDIVAMVVGLLIGLGIGAAVVYFQRDVDTEQARLLEEAQLKAKQMELAAKDDAIKVRDEAEAEAAKRRTEWQREEERLARKREDLDQKLERVDQRERKSNQRQSQLDKLANDLEKKNAQIVTELERVAALTQADAKKELLQIVEADARADMAKVIRQVEAETREIAEERARNHHHGGAARGYRSGRRGLGDRRAAAQRRDEGPHHRAQRAQHPRH